MPKLANWQHAKFDMTSSSNSQTTLIQLYISILGRAPEKSGFNYWLSELNSGKTVSEIAEQIAYLSGNPIFAPSKLSPSQIITTIYTNALGRLPDSEGLQHWINQLSYRSLGDVLVEFVNCVSNYEGTNELALNSKSLFVNKQIIGQLYSSTLNGEDIEVAARIMSKVTLGTNGLEDAKIDLSRTFKLGPSYATPTQFLTSYTSSVLLSGAATITAPSETVFFSMKTQPAHGSVYLSPDGSFQYLAEHNYVGTVEFSILVTDASGFGDTQNIVIKINRLNSAPTIVSVDPYQVSENNFQVGYVFAIDPDPDRLNYQISGGEDAQHFKINPTTGEIRFVKAPDFESPTDKNHDGVFELIVSVNDGNATSSRKFTVSITNESDQVPIMKAIDVVLLDENRDVSQPILTPEIVKRDANAEKIKYQLSGPDASLFLIDTENGQIRFKKSPNFEDPLDEDRDNDYFIYLTAQDTQGKASSQPIHIKITNQLENFTIQNDNYSFDYRGMFSLDVLKNDATDSTNLKIISVTQPQSGGHVSIHPNGKSILFSLTNSSALNAIFSYTVQSSDGTSSTAQVHVTAPSDIFTSIEKNDFLTGDSNPEYFEGGGGNDTIDGGGGGDRIDGGIGDDTLHAHGTENLVHGGTGLDTLILNTRFTSLLALNLQNESNQGLQSFELVSDSNSQQKISDGTPTVTVLRAFENVDASSLMHGIVIQDTTHSALLKTGDGNDTILATSSLVTLDIDSGNGNNTVIVSDSPKVASIKTGNGNDLVTAGKTTQTISTGAGNDTIHSSGDGALIDAGEGNNYIAATGSSLTVYCGEGSDTIYLKGGNNVVFSRAGNDTVVAGNGKDYINLGNGDDHIFLSSSLSEDDTIIGGDGRDTLFVSTINVNDSMLRNVSFVEQIDITTTDTSSVELGKFATTAGLGQVTLNGLSASAIDLNMSGFNGAAGLKVITKSNLGSIQVVGSNATDIFEFNNYPLAKLTVDGGNGGDQILLDLNTQTELRFSFNKETQKSLLLANADQIFGFNKETGKLNIDGINLNSAAGDVHIQSFNVDPLKQKDGTFISANADQFSNLVSNINKNAVFFQISDQIIDTNLKSQQGIFDAVDFITSHIGIQTMANIKSFLLVNDGFNTALFLYDEGSFNDGIQIEELCLIGVLNGIVNLSSDNFI